MTYPAHDREYETLGDALESLVRLDRTDTVQAEILREEINDWAEDDTWSMSFVERLWVFVGVAVLCGFVGLIVFLFVMFGSGSGL